MEEIGQFERLQKNAKNKFEILPTGYKINIEFNNLTYEVPDQKKGMKSILKNVDGEFRSGQLTAIMGPSGSGKTTLINLLAGYRINKTSGDINVNNKPQDMKLFHKISRYILQDDHVSPYFTVMESMVFAAELKLDHRLKQKQIVNKIEEILQILHLAKHANTKVLNLSGGEKKRLCIALELLDIPAVLFLDEPTTGLDEFSAMQCMSMLRRLVASGRTIICSVHSPSARMLQMFDRLYVLADGECVYHGSTTNIVPYINKIGLDCPITYNPADFIIEVAAHEYGNYHNEMVIEAQNGKSVKWLSSCENEKNQIDYFQPKIIEDFEMDLNTNLCEDISTPWLLEFKVLYIKMLKQMWRDKAFIKLKVLLQLFIAFCIIIVYPDIGTNASIIIYNYNLVLMASITFTFASMCPMLSHIPLQMNCLRREYFNQWYRFSSYFMALITSQMPEIFLLGFITSAMLYFLTDQPLELNRFLLFLIVMLLTSMTASSYGIALSSRLNLVNSLYFGPSVISCWIIFATHTTGNSDISIFQKMLMYSGFIRHSAEGLMSALFEYNRPEAVCPADVVFCPLKNKKLLFRLLGYEKLNYVHSIIYIMGFYVLFNLIGYYNFCCRLDSINFLNRNRYYQILKRSISKYVYLKLY